MVSTSLTRTSTAAKRPAALVPLDLARGFLIGAAVVALFIVEAKFAASKPNSDETGQTVS